MKKTLSILLCLLLIFLSVSSVFAVDWSSTDSSNLQAIKNTLTNTSGGTIYYMISQINAAMRFNNKTIANWLSDIEAELSNTLWYVDGNTSRSITWWVKEAVLDLDQLVGTGSGTVLYYLNNIDTMLNTINTTANNIKASVDNVNTNTSAINTKFGSLLSDYMDPMRNVQTLYIPKIYQDAHKTSGDTLGSVSFYGTYSNGSNPWTFSYKSTDHLIGQGLSELLKNDSRFYGAWHNTSGTALGTVTGYSSYNGDSFTYTYYSTDHLLAGLYNNLSQAFGRLLSGYASTQTAKNWLTLNNKTFTPTSQTNGLYSWLANIQEPIARLSYVHASDEEIAAREKAAANQTAVVNNFIDSSGSGATPASSFGSVASMSSGYTSNMNTDASVSGIWNIFNSNNFGWFSQETTNQLDTTVSTRKGSSDFETPLLDQQIAEIYKELGVDVND